MQKIDGCMVTTAKSTEEIVSNIKENIKWPSKIELFNTNLWRDNIPLNIVGGGPSLKKEIETLIKYRFEKDYVNNRYIMACGSVHDYLIENGIIPNWTVVCDPDDIMMNYLTRKHPACKYLLASQCSPKLFDYFRGYDNYIWHAGGENVDNSVFGENKVVVGGGCTVGTRAICLGIGMGFNNINLFGFDTCLDQNFKHHAYEFVDKEKESIGNIHEISLDGPTGRKFYVAGYMLGQLFDFQMLLKIYGGQVKFTVHGDGLLKHLMDLAEIKMQQFREHTIEKLELQNAH